MKKLLFAFVLLIFSTFCFIPQNVYAETSYITEVNNYIQTYYLDHFNNVKDRTAGSSGEQYMGNLLCDFLSDKEFSYFNNLTSYKQTFNISNGKTSSNIIGLKNNSAEKYIIIGSHYDSVFIDEKSYGYVDNLSGVITTMLTADLIASVSNVNVIVAFWGAEEVGLKGSTYFVNNLPQEIINNLALYINFDTVGAGDYRYYCTSNFSTNYGTYIDDFFANVSIRKYTDDLFSSLKSDNNTFLSKGINSLSFFAGNTDSILGYTEKSGHSKIIHSTDAKEVVESVFNANHFAENIDFFAQQTFNLISNTNFNSEHFVSNQVPITIPTIWIIIIFFLMAVIVVAVIYLIRFNKKNKFSHIKIKKLQ